MKILVGFLVIFLFSISLFGQDSTNYMRKYGISDEEDWRKKRESYYLNSINIDENDIHSYYFKGIDNMCIELVGENPEYLLARSIANRELGNLETVIPDLKKAISLDSSFYDAYVELGWTYYIIGDYDNCIAHSMLAQQGESNIVAMYNVALSKLRQDKYAEAELFYQVAMEQDLMRNSTNNKIAIERLKYLIENNIHKEKAEEILNILMHK